MQKRLPTFQESRLRKAGLQRKFSLQKTVVVREKPGTYRVVSVLFFVYFVLLFIFEYSCFINSRVYVSCFYGPRFPLKKKMTDSEVFFQI